MTPDLTAASSTADPSTTLTADVVVVGAGLAGLAAASVQLVHARAGDACSVASPCSDSDAPCCSAGGTCGGGAEQW